MRPGGPTIASTQSGPRRQIGSALLGFALAYPLLLTWVYFDLLAGRSAFAQQGVYWPGKALQFALPLLFARLMVRGGRNDTADRRVRAGSPGRTAGLLVGVAFGLTVAAIFVGISRFEPLMAILEPAIRAKATGLGIATPLRFVLVGAFYTLGHSFLEEWYWRGFVDQGLRRRLPAGAALLVSSLGFAAHHALLVAVFLGWSSPVTWAVTGAVALGGAFWSWLREREGTLLAPWVSHAVVDAAVFTFGYFLAV